MGTSALLVALTVSITSVTQTSAVSGAIKKSEIDYQNQNFEAWWGSNLEWNFKALPEKGAVPKWRIPYSGHDYPDRGGGTQDALVVYDRAFNSSMSATSWEKSDTGDRSRGRGLFARLRRSRVPAWYGHCNGWTAAAIRHAEPQKSVVRNGVSFSPAVIKGLLAEIYMYNDTEFLGGTDTVINPALLHVILTNWIGRGKHPVGLETTPGEVVFNYPAYAYAFSKAEQEDGEIEIKINVAYAKSSNFEANKSTPIKATMYFHYVLTLDDDGKIIAGRYYNDSSRIDMLWTPLKPVQAGEKGNERGNPHVNVKEILAIWRESVPQELRDKWLNIDPTEEDRVLTEEEEAEIAAAEAAVKAAEAAAEESLEASEQSAEEAAVDADPADAPATDETRAEDLQAEEADLFGFDE